MKRSRLIRLVWISVIICFSIGILVLSGIIPGKGNKARLFLLKSEYLELTKKLWKGGDKLIGSSMKVLIRKADAALKRGPYTVINKKNLPPSGDKHDFFAIMGYCWPNPDTKDGHPWIVRDGYLNPEAAGDWKQFKPMTSDLELLGLAYYFTGNEDYAKHAALLLRTWFVDKATRMNPQAPYSKMAPGFYDQGYAVAGFGKRFRYIYDAAGILERSSYWTAEDRSGLKQWTREFMQWVETSKHGKIEDKRDNNHGTFYDFNMALQALYVEDNQKAQETIKSYIQDRFPRQFNPDGTQDWEMKRANNYDYHRHNLMTVFDIAQLGDHFDNIDVWNHRTAGGASLRSALQFLIPFFTGVKKWPYFAGNKFEVPNRASWRLLRRAALGFKDYSFEKKAEEVPGLNNIFVINLIYPEAAIPNNPNTGDEAAATGMSTKTNKTPRLFLLNKDYLELTRELWENGNRLIAGSMKILIAEADLALKKGPYTVTKKTELPPSGDKHDFFAYMGYAWPNPETKDGLPWIVRDGHSNPKTHIDWNRIYPMADSVFKLALAYYFTGKEVYARHAALLLRVWFINKATRMNPNVKYGKVMPSTRKGGYSVAGFGYVFRELYDAAGILESSASWTDQDRQGLQQWTREFISWVETSAQGELERKRKNNHGTFYDINMALQAMYIGDEKKAHQVIKKYMRVRMYKQFLPDGTQPFEMKRANNYDYHRVNLMMALDIAQLADHFDDIDVWNYITPQGGGLRKSTIFLIPYLTQQKKWPYFRGEQFKISGHDRWSLLQRAALGFIDVLFDKAALEIPQFHQHSITHLIYPRLALMSKLKKSSK